MTHQLQDLVRHNTWANRRLMAFLKAQPASVLELNILPGGFDNIINTMNHTINSEASYLRRLSGAWEKVPWDTQVPVGLDVLDERLELIAGIWESLLQRDLDADAPNESYGDNQLYFTPFGVIFTQAIHHGSEHRCQISDILGFHGIEPPDLSSWDYALDTGRSWLISEDES